MNAWAWWLVAAAGLGIPLVITAMPEFGMFAAGAVAASVAASLGVGGVAQVLIFVVVSVALVAVVRGIALRHRTTRPERRSFSASPSSRLSASSAMIASSVSGRAAAGAGCGDAGVGAAAGDEDGDGACPLAICRANSPGSGSDEAWMTRSSAISPASIGSAARATSSCPLSSNCQSRCSAWNDSFAAHSS